VPYTPHGHWFGAGEPATPGPALAARCGGTTACPECRAAAKAERRRLAGVHRCRIKTPVDVVQWTGGNAADVADFLGGSPGFNSDTNGGHWVMFADQDGKVRAAARGDYLVRGHGGSVFAVTPAFYAENYEPIDGPTPDNSPEAVLARYRESRQA
jgi:hypothetical protein